MFQRIRLVAYLIVLSLVLPSLLGGIPHAQAYQPAGYQEFYVLGNSSLVVREFIDASLNFNPSTAQPYGVFSIVSSQNETRVYIDQKYNGYTFDVSSFSGYDAVFELKKGAVLTFDNWAPPYYTITPSGGGSLISGTLQPVDGGDYVVVAGGPMQAVRGFTDRQSGTGTNGTFVAEMTEVYPVDDGGVYAGTSFRVPVGENTPTTRDFNGTGAGGRRGGSYLLIQSYYDDTSVSYTLKGVPQANLTLNRGESVVIPHVWQNDVVLSNKKIQVVLMASGGYSYDTRFFNLPDVNYPAYDFYAPTFPSSTNVTMNIRFHIFAVTSSFVTIETSTGIAPGWNSKFLPANTTDVSFTTNGRTPVHIFGRPGDKLIVLVSLDTASPNYDWGYVLKDKRTFGNQYYIPYAPSGLRNSYDMQLYVMPLFDGTTIFADYNQDGIPEANVTLNRMQSFGFYDPSDLDNTGTRLYADFPFTVVYGESALADSGGNLAGFDWGYQLLPLDFLNYDTALQITKSASAPVVNASGTLAFALNVSTGDYDIFNVNASDVLPPGFAYVTGSSQITFPNGTVMMVEPSLSGQTLFWPTNLNMSPSQSMLITFTATASSEAGYYENLCYAYGRDLWNDSLIPQDSEFVTVSSAGIVFGRLIDATDPLNPAPVPGVTVWLFNGTTGSLLNSTVTDGNGFFRFLGLPGGTYFVAYNSSDPDVGPLLPLDDDDPLLPADNPSTSSSNFTLPPSGIHEHNFRMSLSKIDLIKLDDPDPVVKQTILDGNHRTEINYTIIYSVPADAPVSEGTFMTDDLGFFIGYKANTLRLNGVLLTDALDADAGDFNVTTPGAITVHLGTLRPGDSGNITWTGRVCDCFFGTLLNNTAFVYNIKGFVASAEAQTTVNEPPYDNATIFGTVQNLTSFLPIGIGGVTVYLFNDSGLLGTFNTTPIGSYRFENLSIGTYYVNYSAYDPSVVGLIAVNDTDGGDPRFGTVIVTNATGLYEHDFNLTKPAGISGVVFIDNDGDTYFGLGDTPLVGVNVTLIQGGEVVAWVLTDSSGFYNFTDVMPGEVAVAYDITPLVPLYYPSSDTDGGLPYIGYYLLEIGGSVIHDFALLPPASISGVVYVDTTLNGLYDFGDPLVAGVNVTLLSSGSEFAYFITGIDGAYAFTDLLPGNYSVSYAPSALTEYLPFNDSDGGVPYSSDPYALTYLSNVTHDFGLVLSSSINGTVFLDNNGDGIFDPGDTPLPGINVTLYDINGYLGSSVTGADGKYSFTSLYPGTYNVTYDASGLPYLPSNDTDGGDPKLGTVVLLQGNSSTHDFALVTPPTVGVSKGGPSSAFVGDLITYTIAIHNTGGAPAINVTVIDILPVDVDYVGSDPEGDVVAGAITWLFPRVEPGETIYIEVTVEIKDTVQDDQLITNYVNCSWTDEYGSPYDPSEATWETIVNTYPQLVMEKSGPAVAYDGDLLTYTITVQNIGGTAATNVVVRDTIPSLAKYVGSSPAGIYLQPTVTWIFPTIAPGASEVMEIQVRLPAWLREATCPCEQTQVIVPNGTVIENRASATYSDVLGNYYEPISSKVQTTIITSAHVIVEWYSEEYAPLGGIMNYSASLLNIGGSAAYNFTMVATLAPGMEFAGASHPGIYNASTGEVFWRFDSIPGGDRESLWLAVSFDEGMGEGPVQPSFAWSWIGGSGEQFGPFTSVIVTNALRPSSITIEKTATGITYPGGAVQYAITLRNTGGATATSIRVVEGPLADGTYTGAARYAQIQGNSLVWDLESLPAGSALTLTYGVVLSGSASNASFIDSTTSVYWSDIFGSWGPVNASSRTAVYVPSLLVSIQATAPLIGGKESSFTLTVRNAGNLPLENATLICTGLGIEERIGHLGAGSLYAIEVLRAVPNWAYGYMNLTAYAFGTFESYLAEAFTTVSFAIARPAIKVGISTVSGSQALVVGDQANFAILITNEGDTAITSLPLVLGYDSSKISFKSSGATVSPTVNVSAGTLRWANLLNAPLLPGQTIAFNASFQVTGGVNTLVETRLLIPQDSPALDAFNNTLTASAKTTNAIVSGPSEIQSPQLFILAAILISVTFVVVLALASRKGKRG